jgi:hypothetical protein
MKLFFVFNEQNKSLHTPAPVEGKYMQKRLLALEVNFLPIILISGVPVLSRLL